MKDFFPIETPYDSEDYKLMKAVVNAGIDSHLEGFTKSEFKKSPNFNNKFLWNIHNSELPILYRRLEDLYNETGNSDFESLLDDIRKVADTSNAAIAAGGEYGEEDLDEMIDPYDPMDDNQTMNGEPAGNSDLNSDGIDTAPAYSNAPEMANRGIENYIDDDSIGQELAAENSSDSLANQHGMNAKPNTIDETTDTERYEDVVFMQGDEANEPLEILKNKGPEAALKHLEQWHDSGNHMGSNELGLGDADKTYKKDGYILFWNPYIGYIGLTYDTENGINEDSQMKRHLAGQREKTVPLGQHSPHSQAAIKENKK